MIDLNENKYTTLKIMYINFKLKTAKSFKFFQ